MTQLPSNAVPYLQTAIFTQDTIPSGLLREHTTKAGTWGKINVISGKLHYQILTTPPQTYLLTPTVAGIIEPQVPHQVEPLGETSFYVEFYQIPEAVS
ncbi:MAG: DUF1971 domain-containing protein [Moorea sp. SIO2B7]|nr:DUF1971 domain-containing protein [Moorena sp. SIO2B7]